MIPDNNKPLFILHQNLCLIPTSYRSTSTSRKTLSGIYIQSLHAIFSTDRKSISITASTQQVQTVPPTRKLKEIHPATTLVLQLFVSMSRTKIFSFALRMEKMSSELFVVVLVLSVLWRCFLALLDRGPHTKNPCWFSVPTSVL